MEHRRRVNDPAFTPARLATDALNESPFMDFCDALSPLSGRRQGASQGARFFRTPAHHNALQGSAPSTGGVLLGPSADTLVLNSGGPLSLLMPPPTQRAAQLTGGARGLPSALTKRRRGGRLPVAFALDDPQQGLNDEAAGGGEAEEEGELMQLDPPARGVGLRSAGPAYASTASKSLRPALAVSPRSALALRRCLSFETPRGGGRSGTRRGSLGGGAWVTSRGGGAFTTPLNARVPRRGRASLDSAPTPLPDTPELDGAEEEEEDAARTGSARRSRSRSSACGRCNCKKSKCLKLYCECFAAGVYCNACSCDNCLNQEVNARMVADVRAHVQLRNPLAFKPKIVGEAAETPHHNKGCRCKKSACQKKYCECFQAGVPCSDHCKCEGCKNCGTTGGGGAGAQGPFRLPAPRRSSLPAPITPSISSLDAEMPPLAMLDAPLALLA